MDVDIVYMRMCIMIWCWSYDTDFSYLTNVYIYSRPIWAYSCQIAMKHVMSRVGGVRFENCWTLGSLRASEFVLRKVDGLTLRGTRLPRGFYGQQTSFGCRFRFYSATWWQRLIERSADFPDNVALWLQQGVIRLCTWSTVMVLRTLHTTPQ